MVSGWGAGEAGNATRLDCDCYMPALSDGADPVLFVTVRGERNIGTVQVALGGPGGVAVPQDGEAWVPLPFPLRTGQWGRLTIVADPISRKAEGAFDVTVSQGNERESTPNIPFRPDYQGNYPGARHRPADATLPARRETEQRGWRKSWGPRVVAVTGTKAPYGRPAISASAVPWRCFGARRRCERRRG